MLNTPYDMHETHLSHDDQLKKKINPHILHISR